MLLKHKFKNNPFVLWWFHERGMIFSPGDFFLFPTYSLSPAQTTSAWCNPEVTGSHLYFPEIYIPIVPERVSLERWKLCLNRDDTDSPSPTPKAQLPPSCPRPGGLLQVSHHLHVQDSSNSPWQGGDRSSARSRCSITAQKSFPWGYKSLDQGVFAPRLSRGWFLPVWAAAVTLRFINAPREKFSQVSADNGLSQARSVYLLSLLRASGQDCGQ